MGYNGWRNYETWLVNLWLSNDRGTYEYMVEIAEEVKEEIKDAAEEAKEEIKDVAEDIKEAIEEITD